MSKLTLNQRKVLDLLRNRGKISTREVSSLLKVSRQYSHALLRSLVSQEKLIPIGIANQTTYVDPAYAKKHPQSLPSSIKKRFRNKKGIEEHSIEEELRERFPLLNNLKENIASIFTYAISEMLNNAIEHSKSVTIDVEISIKGRTLIFNITDAGIGVFRNVMHKKKLRSQQDAARELLKGKVTTQPKAHSGQGIFFTSKSADLFILDSYGVRLIIDTQNDDVKITNSPARFRGTIVRFILATDSKKHLSNVFTKYEVPDDDFDDFNKTEIKVALYSKGILVSRSQARKILTSLDKFKAVALDYGKVPIIGQAFADEIYRVFKLKHPEVQIYSINVNENVKHMIDKAQGVRRATGQTKLL